MAVQQPAQGSRELGRPGASEDERGSMLIVALGILALLSILALTFVKLMSLEQKATTNYVDGVKARMIAEGGLERSMAQLKAMLSTTAFDDPKPSWLYADGDYSLPLEQASADTVNANPRLRASFAGQLGISYHGGVDQYKTKVLDAQTQFNLNSEFEPRATTQGDPTLYDWGYIRFLDALGEAIAKLNLRAGGRNPILNARYPRESSGTLTGSQVARGGKAIYMFRQSREGGRFKSKTELLEVLEHQDDLLLLQDFVTCYSWRDPKTVVVDSQGDDLKFAQKPWSQLKPATPDERRSPININLASREVIAANLAGIAGRAVYLYRDPEASSYGRQNVDADSAVQDYRDTNDQHKEDKEDPPVIPVLVYITPFAYEEKASAAPGAAPPIIDGALALAQKIVADREGRPFRSHADWEAWVDQNIGTNSAGGRIDLRQTSANAPSGFMYPQPQQAKLVAVPPAISSGTTATILPNIAATPDFQAWFYEAVKDMLKANFNPNGRTSAFSPNDVAYLAVDKGNLVYHDPAEKDPNDPDAGPPHRRQTLEWCFSPKGVFEVTALGEVLGPPPADPKRQVDADGDGKFDPEVFAQAKVRGVVQLYDSVVLTSQRDFERDGGDGSDDYGVMRDGLVSYPVPKVYWDPFANPDRAAFWRDFGQSGTTTAGGGGGGSTVLPDDSTGYLQLAPFRARGDTKNTHVVDMDNQEDVPRFELLFQDRRIELPAGRDRTNHFDNLQADTSAGVRNGVPGMPRTERVKNVHGWPYGTARDGIHDGRYFDADHHWRHLPLTPEGYLNTELRPSELWYRASDEGVDQAGNNKWPFPETYSTIQPNDPDANRRGRSFVDPGSTNDFINTPKEGNVAPTNIGGVELWYKPDFDWVVRDAQGNELHYSPLTCGLLSTSHVLENPDGWWYNDQGSPAGFQQGTYTRGTQMFVLRTSTGDLRVTRLFYDVVGEYITNPSSPRNQIELPFVERPGGGDPISITEYWKNCVTQPEVYRWPPRALRNTALTRQFVKIAHARVDFWIPKETFRGWRAREWHHLALRWDDAATSQTSGRKSIEAWVDGTAVNNGTFHEVGPRYEPVVYDPTNTTASPVSQVNPNPFATDPVWPLPGSNDGKIPQFVRLNADARPNSSSPELERPKDQITIGSVIRDQLPAASAAGDGKAGLFKFEVDGNINLPANGTIDDVRFYRGRRNKAPTIDGLIRYEDVGLWEGEFDLATKFPSADEPLTLGALSFTGYLPTRYGLSAPLPQGVGAITVSFRVVRKDGTEESPSGWLATMTSNLGAGSGTSVGFSLVDDQGKSVRVYPGDKLVYSVEMAAGTGENGTLSPSRGSGKAIVTPVLDDLSLTFFLPTATTLLKERVNN